jgi:hypothetical protein
MSLIFVVNEARTLQNSKLKSSKPLLDLFFGDRYKILRVRKKIAAISNTTADRA